MNLFRDVFPAIGFPVQTFTPITEGLTSFFSAIYIFFTVESDYINIMKKFI